MHDKERSIDGMEEINIEASDGQSKPEPRKKGKKIKSAYKSVSREIRQAKSSRMYVFNFFLFASAGCLLPFLPIFFKLLGFSTLQNGILVSSRGLVTFWSGPLMSSIHHLAVFTNAAVFVCVVGFVIDTFSLALVQDGFRGGLAVNKSLCLKHEAENVAKNLSAYTEKRALGNQETFPSLLEMEKGFTKIRRSLLSLANNQEPYPSDERYVMSHHDRQPRSSRRHWDDRDFTPDNDDDNDDDFNRHRFRRPHSTRRRRRRRTARNRHKSVTKKHKNKHHHRKHLHSTGNHPESPENQILPTAGLTTMRPSTEKSGSNFPASTTTDKTITPSESVHVKQPTHAKHHKHGKKPSHGKKPIHRKHPVSPSYHPSTQSLITKSTVKITAPQSTVHVTKLPPTTLLANGNGTKNFIQRVKNQVLTHFPMPKIFFAILVITFLSELFFSILCYKSELVDEVGRYFCPSVFAMNRLWGRIGYCITAFASAYVTWRLTCNYTASNTFYFHFYGFVAVGGCTLIASLCLPLKKRPKSSPCKDCCAPWRLVLCNLQAFTFSVTLVVIGMADVIADAYILWYTHDLGGTELVFGSMITIAIMTDVLFYCFLGISIQWIGHSGLLTFAVLISGAQFVAVPYIHNVWLLIPTQVLRGIATAASRTAIFDFSNFISPLGMENSVHALFQTIYSGLGVGVGGLYLAVVCSVYGIHKLFQGMAAVCFIYGTIYCLVSLLQFTINHGRVSVQDYEKVQPDIIPENDWLVEALEESERFTRVSKG